MEENKNIPTTEGEAIAPEASVTDIPGTDAPSPDLTDGTPQQEQAGVTMAEPGDVVVSFDKIEELMAERRAAARDTVEKAEPTRLRRISYAVFCLKKKKKKKKIKKENRT